MKRLATALLLCLSALPLSTHAVQLTLNGAPLEVGEVRLYEGTTFVPLRGTLQALLPQAEITWEDGAAIARWEENTLIARPDEAQLTYNDEIIPLAQSVRLENGRTLVPVRALCALLDVSVDWYAGTQVAALSTLSEPLYREDELYWLSRIISAESQGEPWTGKLAVGYVVLNRVAHTDFPDTVYGVIFDSRWGGQFAPVRNGTVYSDPTEESVRAAAACLSGSAENPVGDSLYFIAPALTSNHWTMENRAYITTIGVHWFYE